MAALGLEQIRRIGAAFAGREVLDLGCGTGAPARQAARFGPRGWVGVDRVTEMLDRFHGMVVRADFRTLPFDDSSFDIVLFWISLGYVDSPAPALLESSRVLRPSGRLLILDLHPSGARRGWTRNIGGITIRSTIHSTETWVRSFEEAGLGVVCEDAILIDESVRSSFESSGKNFTEFEGQELLIFYDLCRKAAAR